MVCLILRVYFYKWILVWSSVLTDVNPHALFCPASAMAVQWLRGCRLFSPNEYKEIPDGGWGWLVAVAFFLVEVFTYGTIKSFGIFLQDLVKEFNKSNSEVSWVLSICVFVMTFMGECTDVRGHQCTPLVRRMRAIQASALQNPWTLCCM